MLTSRKPSKQLRKAQTLKLGVTIRQRRKALKKTIQQVAEETGLTPGFISQVERGISAPSLSSMVAIAAALGTSVEQFLSVPEEFCEFVPADKRQTYSLGNAGRFYEKLGPGFAGSLMYPTMIHRPVGQVSENMCHPGEVFFHLLSGQVEYNLDGRVFIMSAGDSLHHDTSRPHHSTVIGDTESVELWVSSFPILGN